MRSLTDRHPADGVLRRLVDEPAGVSDADRAHVAGCAVCLAGLAAAQQDAAVVGAALRSDAAPDVDAAWRRFSTASAPARAAVPAPPRRRRISLRSPVVAALGVVLILGGAGAAAAADWLQIFRTEHVAAVPVTQADLVALPDLSAYGDLKVIAQPDVHQVDSLDAAREASGLDVPIVSELPAGVTGNPSFTVGGQLVAEFTFSAAKAAQAAGNAPPPPPGLDGATFRLQAGPGVAETWSESHGVPALIVARVVAPTAFSSGVPFATARDYLLSLPGLPDQLANQLRSFTGDGTTLPLPVPEQLVTTSTADVNGTTATVLASRDGALTGVVWVSDGVLTGVAGSLSEDEVLAVAREQG
jgi:hypothetical protein